MDIMKITSAIPMHLQPMTRTLQQIGLQSSCKMLNWEYNNLEKESIGPITVFAFPCNID